MCERLGHPAKENISKLIKSIVSTFLISMTMFFYLEECRLDSDSLICSLSGFGILDLQAVLLCQKS